MQAIANGYRGIGFLAELVGDRVLAPLAIAGSLYLATRLIAVILTSQPAVSPSFF